MNTIETPESFCDRVLALAGIEFAAIPDVPPEALLSGQILCTRGRTRIVTTGYPVTRKDADGKYEVYASFGVVERDADLPAYLAGVAMIRIYNTEGECLSETSGTHEDARGIARQQGGGYGVTWGGREVLSPMWSSEPFGVRTDRDLEAVDD